MGRVFVIGFDGATWRFIRPLVQRGEMPNFERLMKEGASGDLESTIPFQSAAAWVTFMTGKNSGKHGVYMFQDYDALSYDYVGRTANSRYFAGQTIFDILGQLGKTVAAVRVPMTFPAWKINGIMVSGFPTPGDTPDSFYPTSLRDELGAAASPDEQGDFRLLTTEQQVEALDGQMDRMSNLVRTTSETSYDFYMAVHRVSDEIHHFFMGFVDPRTPVYDAEKAGRWGDVINRFYRKMDVALGETLDKLQDDDTIFVISDHGGNITPPKQLNLNVWLANQGLLVPKERAKSVKERVYALNQKFMPAKLRSMLRRNMPKSARGGLTTMWQGLQEIDFARTQAYHFPMKCPPLVGIVINVQGRQRLGTVSPEQYEALRDRIMRDVKTIRDPRTGEAVVERVYKREDLYQGEFVERAPDIIVWCKETYKEGPLAQGPVIGQVPYDELLQVPGAHDEHGIFLAKGPGIAAGVTVDNASLIDVTPTILHAMGIGVPKTEDGEPAMDGRVLADIFTEPERDVQELDLVLARQSSDTFLSEDEEQQIKDKLKGWGYL